MQYAWFLFLLFTLVPVRHDIPSAPAPDGFRSGIVDSLLPRLTDSVLVQHKYYSLSYRPRHGQAEWVAYWLADSMITAAAKRQDRFRFDPAVPGGSARPIDYRATGFDKGHLCPAADMSWDSVAMAETFFMSNMSPQMPAFNRGVWKELEEFVRNVVRQGMTIFVVTGPVLSDTLRSIGRRTRISVPASFYKILYRSTDSTQHVSAFLLSNTLLSQPLSTFLVTVDSVEAVTGIDFFSALDDSLERAIECRIDTTWWGTTAMRR